MSESDGGWQLDEQGARAYEQTLVPALMDGWARDLLLRAPARSGQRVLDVACGTGIVARHAVRLVGADGEVVGVDLNPAMLAVASEVSGHEDAPITFREARADDLPFPDASFDIVLCQQGLQFFPDAPAALAEMARVTRTGGRLGLSTCRSIEHQPGYQALTAAVETHVGANAADIIRSPYAAGDTDQLRAWCEDAGLDEVRVHISVSTFRAPDVDAFLRAETASSPLGDVVEALDDDVRDGLLEDLAERLAPHRDDTGIVFPFESVTVTAIRSA